MGFPLTLIHHVAKSGGCTHCGNRDMFFVMVSQDHMIKGSCDFMGETNHTAKFGGHRHCGSGDMLLVYHMASLDHMLK